MGKDYSLVDRLTSPGPKRILSLDGGGVRGAFSLSILERLEDLLRKRHGDPNLKLCEYFDLIGGTSTGAIIAAGLAIGMTASEVKEKYFEFSSVVFGKRRPISRFISKSEKYDTSILDNVLNSIYGDIQIGDQDQIKTGLCIITKRIDTFSTWPIINHPNGKYYNQNRELPLWKAVRASVAAPSFFLPIQLDVGGGEKGVFVDGGISLACNPGLLLFLVSTLQGFPFHWRADSDNLLLVSIGTSQTKRSYRPEQFEKVSLLKWAVMIPIQFMSEANSFNQMILQWLSDSPTAEHINSEIGDLKDDIPRYSYALSYVRYDAVLDDVFLKSLGFSLTKQDIGRLSCMDNARNTKLYSDIGTRTANKLVTSEHIPAHFDVSKVCNKVALRVFQGDKLSYVFKKYIKKPIPIQAIQISEPFEVQTLEGLMKGKAGDYLIRGVQGEYYICDKDVFMYTYQTI